MMEEATVGTDGDESYDYDSFDERPAERWAPLGAANDVASGDRYKNSDNETLPLKLVSTTRTFTNNWNNMFITYTHVFIL